MKFEVSLSRVFDRSTADTLKHLQSNTPKPKKRRTRDCDRHAYGYEAILLAEDEQADVLLQDIKDSFQKHYAVLE